MPLTLGNEDLQLHVFSLKFSKVQLMNSNAQVSQKKEGHYAVCLLIA